MVLLSVGIGGSRLCVSLPGFELRVRRSLVFLFRGGHHVCRGVDESTGRVDGRSVGGLDGLRHGEVVGCDVLCVYLVGASDL